MTNEQSDSVYEASAGPIFRKAVTEAVDGGMDAGAKAQIAQSLSDLSLPAAVTATIQLEVYKEQLAAKTEIAKIVNEEEVQRM